MGRLIGTRFVRAIRNFFPSECAIQINTPTLDAQNQPIASWADLADHEAIPCRKAPVTDAERRTLGQVVETATHIVALYGAYSATVTVALRCVIDNEAWDITGVREDSEGLFTYLGVRQVVI